MSGSGIKRYIVNFFSGMLIVGGIQITSHYFASTGASWGWSLVAYIMILAGLDIRFKERS